MLLRIVLLSLLLSSHEAVRPFEIAFTGSRCKIIDDSYASSFVCSIIPGPVGQRRNFINVKLVIKRDIFKLLLHFRFIVPRPMSNETYEMFNFKTDGCKLNQLSSKNSLLKAVLKKLVANGNFRKCPMRSNRTFEEAHFFLNPDHFPPYTPDLNFTMELEFIVEQSIRMVGIGVDAAIIRKEKKAVKPQ